MKSTLFLIATLTIITLSISSCKLDNPLNPGNPGKIEPILLLDRYDEDVTLTDHNDDGVDYIATRRIDLFAGEMNIEPGVTIEFEGGSYLNVGLEGKLNAVGTSGEPIRMIAKDNEPSWAGIYVNTSKSNKIHHCIIDNAGSGETHGVFNTFASAITIHGKASVENCFITNSGDVGIIAFSSESDITSLDGNTIRDCVSFPILSNINLLRDLNLSNNIYGDNGKNLIGITDLYADRLVVSTNLEGLPIPYFVDGEFELYEDLTLSRGVELVMADNSLIDHGAPGDYRFEIAGTESDHVVIRGEESENGYWQGIYITSSNSGNIFEYLDISDGGGKELTFRDGKANISLELDGNLTLVNSTSARSGACEVFVSLFGGAPSFTNESPAVTKLCTE